MKARRGLQNKAYRHTHLRIEPRQPAGQKEAEHRAGPARPQQSAYDSFRIAAEVVSIGGITTIGVKFSMP